MTIGKEIEFEVITDNGRKIRKARIIGVETSKHTGKTIFIAVTPFNNVVRLTSDEISRFI
jgi:hypothetical protein